jgi:hypothetical protein
LGVETHLFTIPPPESQKPSTKTLLIKEQNQLAALNAMTSSNPVILICFTAFLKKMPSGFTKGKCHCYRSAYARLFYSARGRLYATNHCLFFECEKAKISRVREYMDKLKICEFILANIYVEARW